MFRHYRNILKKVKRKNYLEKIYKDINDKDKKQVYEYIKETKGDKHYRVYKDNKEVVDKIIS